MNLFRPWRENRRLQSELERLGGAKALADDLVRALQAENAELRTQLSDALQKTVHSVQCVADWMSQQHYGTRIYSAAPALPEKAPEDVIPQPSRVQARRLCEQMEREFLEKYEFGTGYTAPPTT